MSDILLVIGGGRGGILGVDSVLLDLLIEKLKSLQGRVTEFSLFHPLVARSTIGREINDRSRFKRE